MIRKRKIFKWLVDTFDRVSVWFENKFNLNPKRIVLEKQQDLISIKELEKTIGKSLGL